MLVPAEVWTVAKAEQGNAVLVRPLGLDVAVPIFIAPLEAQSILIGLGSVKMPRPLTHDLIAGVFAGLGVKVQKVVVNDLKDDTFYARLYLLQENDLGRNVVEIDARPSDSIVLALQQKRPLYVVQKVFDSVEDMTEILERVLKQQAEEGESEPDDKEEP